MDPDRYWHHPPEGFGLWHHGLINLAWLALPLLFLLPLLAIVAVLLWNARHTIFDRLGGLLPETPARPGPASAVEMLRQRYARGEIDDETFTTMLDRLNDNERYERYQAEGVETGGQVRMADGEDAYTSYRPRADIPVDWS